jgi:hypothetical protein
MKRLFHPLAAALLLALLPQVLPAQNDIPGEFKRLQDAYTQRLNDIETRFQASERELLNAFILSLVRTEQAYRDEGNLDGLVLSRELRETLLHTPAFPDLEDRFPDTLKQMVQTLLQQREEARLKNQKELDDLNRILFTALERFQREFTRAGNFEQAIEIRSMRNLLRDSLGLEQPVSQPSGPVVISTDPNVYPICIEPPGYADVAGVTPRVPQVPFQISVDDPDLAKGLRHYFSLRGGQLSIPAEASSSLIQQVQQNQMLNLEIGLHATHGPQGNRGLPAPLLLFGTTLADSNLAVLQEGPNLFLYLRTTMPPTGQTHHRVNLGPIDAGRAHYIQVTYRSGELTVYRNGTETQKIRSSINGLLSNWSAAPLRMGQLPAPPEHPEPLEWRGNLIQMYMKSSLDSARGADVNFKRFSTYLSQ